MKPTLGFIGAGRIATALAHRLQAEGYTICGILSKSQQSAQKLARDLGISSDTAISDANLIFICVPDDKIADVVKMIDKSDFRGAMVHTSGVHDLDLFESVSYLAYGSFHPLYSFSLDSRIPAEAHMFVAIQASQEGLRRWLFEIAEAIGGQPAEIATGKKPLYHAAGVVASNYLVMLFHVGQAFLLDSGLSTEAANRALLGLMQSTMRNLEEKGDAALALTGPIARGDIATLEIHRHALADNDYAKLYGLLGHYTLELAPNLPPHIRQKLSEHFKG